MSNRQVIIMGSSRSDGDTRRVAEFLKANAAFDLVDLKDYQIGPFDYDNANAGDDFIPLTNDLIRQYDTLVFASPVYWYSMSGLMKDFFDRISDLLKWEKETGRQLRGKNMAVVSVSNANDLVDGFYMPFEESAQYLGMNYLGHVHGWGGEVIEEASKALLIEFIEKLNKSTKRG